MSEIASFMLEIKFFKQNSTFFAFETFNILISTYFQFLVIKNCYIKLAGDNVSSKIFANKTLIFLKKYKDYTDREERIVHYGLETIYIFITKMIFITILSLFFKITKEMYTFIFFYLFLRLYSSGMHLSTGHGCTIFSSILFIGIPFICKYVELDLGIRIIISGITFCIFAWYSPADTHRKPIIQEEKRKKLKLKTAIVCAIYLTLILLIKNEYVLNCINFALIMQSIMILPITYKIFKQPYANYKEYIQSL